jgi:hypothetical protein
MALTANEKLAIGELVDDGVIKKQLRRDVGSSDDLAREQIAKYKQEKLDRIAKAEIAVANASTDIAASKAIWENV